MGAVVASAGLAGLLTVMGVLGMGVVRTARDDEAGPMRTLNRLARTREHIGPGMVDGWAATILTVVSLGTLLLCWLILRG